MAIAVYPVTEHFAAEVGDVDLAALSAEDVAAIKAAFWRYAVLIFPGQRLEQEQHLAFARHFGPLETSILAFRKDYTPRIRVDLADVSNLNNTDKVWGEQSRQRRFQLGNRLWHTDSSFKHVPALCSILYARSIAPVGGHTEFADLRAAWDALEPAEQARLQGKVAEHSIMHSRARLGFTDFNDDDRDNLPPVHQVMARTVPQSGRRTLYVASHAGRVLGMPEAEGRAWIDALLAHATQRQFVYTHRWRQDDVVMWDDRCTLHRGTDFDDLRWRRDFQRATVSDVANSCEQEGVRGVA